MKKELKEAKYALFEEYLVKADKFLGQSPTGKELMNIAEARGTTYDIDFSLGANDAGYCITQNGKPVVCECASLVKKDTFAAFFENVIHETVHATVIEDYVNIHKNPLDECHRREIDEANAVAKTIQIAYEMHVMGIDSSVWEFMNGKESGKGAYAYGFPYPDAAKAYKKALKKDPNAWQKPDAIQSAFIARLTTERKKTGHSFYYDINTLKYIDKLCDLSLCDNKLENSTSSKKFLEEKYGKILTKPETLEKKDIEHFGQWLGENYLCDKNGSMEYLLTDEAKRAGLSCYAKKQLQKTELNLTRTRHHLASKMQASQTEIIAKTKNLKSL